MLLKSPYLLALMVLVLWCCGCEIAHPPTYSMKARASGGTFGRKMTKKYHLKLLGTGTGHIIDSSYKCDFAFNYMDNRKINLEEARVLAKSLAQEFSDLLFMDPVFATYREEVNREYPRHARELAIDQIGFKISFWDENVDRPLHPYIAQIRFIEGDLCYYYAESNTQALGDPITEPFEYEKKS